MAQKVKIDGLADAVMKELTEYSDLATVDMKAVVKKAGNTVKKQIQGSAPKDTGAYSKSWSVKNTKETSKSLEVTVYSRNRYQLAHLLEFGHPPDWNATPEPSMSWFFRMPSSRQSTRCLETKVAIRHSCSLTSLRLSELRRPLPLRTSTRS